MRLCSQNHVVAPSQSGAAGACRVQLSPSDSGDPSTPVSTEAIPVAAVAVPLRLTELRGPVSSHVDERRSTRYHGPCVVDSGEPRRLDAQGSAGSWDWGHCRHWVSVGAKRHARAIEEDGTGRQWRLLRALPLYPL